MKSIPLHDVRAPEGSVFIDNLMISSADRLLSNAYRSLENDVGLQDRHLASALFHHDLVNLATLLEAVVCHEVLFVNSDFINIWNQDIAATTYVHLFDIVTPVAWSTDERASAERILHQSMPLLDLVPSQGEFLRVYMEAVYRASHCRPEYSISKIQDNLLLPRDEAHPWGTPHHIIIGAHFYLLCSQLLGIPYRPSLLRSRILSSALIKLVQGRSYDAGAIALSLLERSRERVAQDLLDQVLGLNYIEIFLPGIFAAVLREAKSPSDILSNRPRNAR